MSIIVSIPEDPYESLPARLAKLLNSWIWVKDDDIGLERAKLLAASSEAIERDLANQAGTENAREYRRAAAAVMLSIVRRNVAGFPSRLQTELQSFLPLATLEGALAALTALQQIADDARLIYLDEEKLLGHLLLAHSFDNASSVSYVEQLGVHRRLHVMGSP